MKNPKPIYLVGFRKERRELDSFWRMHYYSLEEARATTTTRKTTTKKKKKKAQKIPRPAS